MATLGDKRQKKPISQFGKKDLYVIASINDQPREALGDC